MGRARARLVLAGVAIVAVVVFVRGREEHSAAVRATRASISTTLRAVSSWRADHPGKCPGTLGELVAGGYARDVPVDAWGHPLRVQCPGRHDTAGFEVSSDGPDGLPGGIDRVE